jgi:hypothetical protein
MNTTQEKQRFRQRVKRYLPATGTGAERIRKMRAEEAPKVDDKTD